MSLIKLRVPLAQKADGTSTDITFDVVKENEKSYLVFTILLALGFLLVCFIAALFFGGPKSFPASLTAPNTVDSTVNSTVDSSNADFPDLPVIHHFAARDKSQLAYRRYAQVGIIKKGSVILIHGETASSDSMHPLAKAYAAAGYVVYALDLRGHGTSGEKGNIDYVGQLEDDLEDFIREVNPSGYRTLVGFSMGAGFVLRFAADSRHELFDYFLLISPFLNESSVAIKPEFSAYMSLGELRTAQLMLLNGVRFSLLNDLIVNTFAKTVDNQKSQKNQTSEYAYNLAVNMRPHINYKLNIANASPLMEVLVGDNDKLFDADLLAEEFTTVKPKLAVYKVANITKHTDMILSKSGIDAAVSAVARLYIGPVIKARIKLIVPDTK